jgi:DNA-binding transcriptional regulator GbsR (MarR family)
MSEADDRPRGHGPRPGGYPPGRPTPGAVRPARDDASRGDAAREDAARDDASRPDASRGGPGPGDAVYRFIERFSATLGEAGFPRMPARVFVALLSSDAGVMTAAELAGVLRVSPAAVSGGVRYLVQVGLVSSEREPGSRKLRYRMPDDVWQEILRMRDNLLVRWISVLRDGVQTVGADTPAGRRMANSARYFEFVNTELPRLLSRWDDFQAAEDSVDDAP